MVPVLYERVGIADRRISPFSWRIRFALAHKEILPEVVPTRFADVEKIRTLSGQPLVPVLEHNGRVICGSWAIACYLEDNFQTAASLFGTGVGRGTTQFISIWCDHVLLSPVRRVLVPDFLACLDPGDRAYFRASREAAFGAPLEVIAAERPRFLRAFLDCLAPLQETLARQSFVSGEAPAYADYVVFSVFQFARIGWPMDILPATRPFEALRAWRVRMGDLFNGLAFRFGAHPSLENQESVQINCG